MEKRRALLVGAGHWGRTWGKLLHTRNDIDIVAWVDVRDGAAVQAAHELRLEETYTDANLDRAIDRVRPDFVVNVTLPRAHAEVAIQAMDAGLPVLCEKPMADTMENARAMISASERAGKLLMISQQRRYDARLAAMRQLIDNHTGPLGILNSDFYLAHPSTALHDPMPSPLILDMAIHTFDAARFVSAADPIAVYCEDFAVPWNWYRGKASAVAMFEMTGGLRYTYRGSWCSQGYQTTWEAEWRAVGPNGTVIWDGRSAPQADVVKTAGRGPMPTRRVMSEPAADTPASLLSPLQDFLRALDTGIPPMGECHDNIKSLAMVFGAIESAASGQRVALHLEEKT
ncbi:MAG: Gfo/Idh/MocA family oxidoreductase [Chloroflexota bacterium]